MDFDKERFMKEDIPEFSIIIPVFNAENTIDRCLQSVAGQTMNSFEIGRASCRERVYVLV